MSTIQSFSHIPHVHKANLTWSPDDTMMQLNSRRRRTCPKIYQDCINIKDSFANLTSSFPHTVWPEKAAGMLTEKWLAMQPKSHATLNVAALKSCDFRCTLTSRFIEAMRNCCNSSSGRNL